MADERAEHRMLISCCSHHPPVTAYSIWNDKHGVRLTGYCGQKASFSRTINVKVSRASRCTNLCGQRTD